MKHSDIPIGGPPPEGYALSAAGSWVPRQQLEPSADLRDQTVRDLVQRCRAVSAEMSDLKGQLFADLAAHVQLVAEAWGVRLSGRNGNVALVSSDALMRVERIIAPRMRVGADVLAAEALVGELLDELTADASPTLRSLVQQMFRRDSHGNIAPSRLLDFIRLELDDPKWRRAQAAVRHSLEADGQSLYFRAYTRDDPMQPWEQITLDFSRVPFTVPEVGHAVAL